MKETGQPIRIFNAAQNDWINASVPYVLDLGLSSVWLEFVFITEAMAKEGEATVHASALLFNVKGTFLESVGLTVPLSSDRALSCAGDRRTTTDGRTMERMSLALDCIHGRVFSICFLVSSTKPGGCEGLQMLEIRLLRPSPGNKHAMSEASDAEVIRTIYTRQALHSGSNPGKDAPRKPLVLLLGDLRRVRSSITAASAGSSAGSPAGSWAFRAEVTRGVCKTADKQVLVAQKYLKQWIPGLVMQGEELLLHRTFDIVALIDPEVLHSLKLKFTAPTKKSRIHKSGPSIRRDDFLSVLVRILLEHYPRLCEKRQRLQMMGLLMDLWDQISSSSSSGGGGGGSGGQGQQILWQDFVSFWVEAGMVNTSVDTGTCWADEVLEYVKDTDFKLTGLRKPMRQVSKPGLNKLVIAEERSPFVFLMEPTTGQHSQTLRPETSEAESTMPHVHAESYLTVLDCEVIEKKAWIAVSSSDYSISIWNYNPSNQQAAWFFSMHCRCIQTLIRWIHHEQGYLLSSGVDQLISAWDVVNRSRLATIASHKELVTDIIYLPQQGQFAVAAFDKVVRLWNASSFTQVGKMRMRSPARRLKNKSDMLLCVTLEMDAIVMSVSTQRLLCRLVGHQATIVGEEMLQFIDSRHGVQVRAITADSAGMIHIWDVANSQSKGGCADVLKTIDLHVVAPHLGTILACFSVQRAPDTNEIVDDIVGVWPDVVVRGLGGAFKLTAVLRHQKVMPATCLLYDSKCRQLIAATGERLRFWDVQTSESMRVIGPPTGSPDNRSHDVMCTATDHPHHRHIYTGSRDGTVRVFHMATAQLRGERPQAHAGPVSALVKCPLEGTLVSTGRDKRLVVYRLGSGGSGDEQLEVLRTLEHAHPTGVVCCAVSEELGMFATAAQEEIRLWDQESLHFEGGAGALQWDVLQLLFVPDMPFLVCSNSHGDILVWMVLYGAGDKPPGCTKVRGRPCASRSSSSIDDASSTGSSNIAMQYGCATMHCVRRLAMFDEAMPWDNAPVTELRLYRGAMQRSKQASKGEGGGLGAEVEGEGQAEEGETMPPSGAAEERGLPKQRVAAAAGRDSLGNTKAEMHLVAGDCSGRLATWLVSDFMEEVEGAVTVAVALELKPKMMLSGGKSFTVNGKYCQSQMMSGGGDRAELGADNDGVSSGLSEAKSTGASAEDGMAPPLLVRLTSDPARFEAVPVQLPCSTWVAHGGSSVSGLVCMDDTSMIFSAGQDCTLRLWAASDIRIGAWVFGPGGMLGELNMMDMPSRQVDRAELWLCGEVTSFGLRSKEDQAYLNEFGERAMEGVALPGENAEHHHVEMLLHFPGEKPNDAVAVDGKRLGGAGGSKSGSVFLTDFAEQEPPQEDASEAEGCEGRMYGYLQEAGMLLARQAATKTSRGSLTRRQQPSQCAKSVGGKIMYANLHDEILAGSNTNTKMTERGLKGDYMGLTSLPEVDTTMSEFLLQKLPGIERAPPQRRKPCRNRSCSHLPARNGAARRPSTSSGSQSQTRLPQSQSLPHLHLHSGDQPAPPLQLQQSKEHGGEGPMTALAPISERRLGNLRRQWHDMQTRVEGALADVDQQDAAERDSVEQRRLMIKEAKSSVSEYVRKKQEYVPKRVRPSMEKDPLSITKFGGYTRVQVELMGQVFLQYDKDGDFSISYEEFQKAVTQNGVMFKSIKFGQLDLDNNGIIEMGELVSNVFARAVQEDQENICKYLRAWVEDARDRRGQKIKKTAAAFLRNY